ncbi:hypothetical protein CDD82_2396 [Ophiocordyceps australis]|uniref:ACB domain-containing protein n=1 Tax=Ophiocordyceps australis TaxID=1399860 RepID=A0A2C5ZI74_9HYPO|nr:hypothetical protein CDD82_2396 [Ophiocordyceps australis]
MSAPQSEAFEKAVVDSKKLTSKPAHGDLLDLYALYKVSTGEDIANAATPGILDMKAKAKYNAWKKVLEAGVTDPKQAQENYVAKVEEMKQKYGYDENKVPEAVGSA